ncbi:MAG TPA: PAS domain-containing protein, partial [Anaerolineaceae bacterium]|nr:PAS domain-containing protein [Anaerolineaceae bacterium]
MNPQIDVKNLTELILQSVDINFTVTLQGEIVRIYAQLDPSGENTELSHFVGKSISDCTNLDLVKKIHEAIHRADQEDKPGEGLIEFSTSSGMKKVFYAIMPLENKTFFIFLTQKTNESIEHHIKLIKQLFLSLSSLDTLEEGADVLLDHLSKFDPTNTFGIYLLDDNGNLNLHKYSDEVNSELTAQITKILLNPDNWQLISNGITLTKQKVDFLDELKTENFPDFSEFGFFPILFAGKLIGCYVLLTISPISSHTIEFIEEYARESGIILSSIRDYQSLEEQNKFFHSILDASDEVLFVVTETGAPVYYSPKFMEHLQASSETSKNENILTLIDPSQHDHFKELLHNPKLNTITTHQILITPSVSKKKNLEVHLTTIQTNNHTLILAKENPPEHSPSSLETPPQHMLEITAKLPLPLLIVNEHSFRITYANQFIHDYLRYQADELLNRNFLDLFSPTENINLINAIKPGGLSRLESGHAWILERKDQSSV